MNGIVPAVRLFLNVPVLDVEDTRRSTISGGRGISVGEAIPLPHLASPRMIYTLFASVRSWMSSLSSSTFGSHLPFDQPLPVLLVNSRIWAFVTRSGRDPSSPSDTYPVHYWDGTLFQHS